MPDRLGWRDLSSLCPDSARILIVEDDENTGKALRRLLERMGFEAKHVESAEVADGWLQSTDFDAVLLDLHLPRMNGLEFLRWVLRRSPQTAVIMVTGDDNLDLALTCMREGARTYLIKPVEPEVLELAVRDALAVRQLLIRNGRGLTG